MEEKRINTKEDLRDWLDYELRRYPNYGRYRIYNVLLMSENAVLRRHQILLRKTEYHINSGHRFLSRIYRMRLELFQMKWRIHIPPNVFGRGLKVMHVGEMHINGRARAGENCTVHAHTSLAAAGFNDGVPSIGSGVVLFMGAIVAGDIHIADNVVIGANSVVTRSVEEENVTVSGNPAKVVSHKGRLEMERNRAGKDET
ncbi:MAG TPA: serine acetyltransferase [Candidatus Limivicinus faecipullorum]|nr:serine acetyltransferase [Candidatus Limivicinus faecipullorum]